MSVITIFSGDFCRANAVVREIVRSGAYRLIDDGEIVAATAAASGMSSGKVMRAFCAKTSAFNKFTHEKERAIAHLRLVVAASLAGDRVLFCGFAGQLIPREVSHVLRVCLIAERKSRIALASEERRISEKEALRLIRKRDEDCAAWVHTLFQRKDPWDASLHDMVIPVDKVGPEAAATLIVENADKGVVKPTERSRRAAADFLVAARAEVALAGEGHSVGVSARDGSVTLTINHHVLRLGRLEEELRAIAAGVPGVRSVETKVGPGFYKANIYRKVDFEIPSKVLLVDDEREFVQTLSERLLMRDMGSTVAYDGESALKLLNEEEPEVMILDLKMPGIDGMEVLRRVKEVDPDVEVIILTGHASEEDRVRCMELGAFAYLEKPVDIDELSDTLRKANARILEKKAAGEKGD